MNNAAEPSDLDIADAGVVIRSGQLTVVELVESVLHRIAAMESHLRAFVSVDREAALITAKDLDHELRSGSARGPLLGIPIAVKDISDVAPAAHPLRLPGLRRRQAGR